MSRTNQKPITEPSHYKLCNILLWTIMDGGGKFWSNIIPDKKI